MSFKTLSRKEMANVLGGLEPVYEYCALTCADGKVVDALASPPCGNKSDKAYLCKDHGGDGGTCDCHF